METHGEDDSAAIIAVTKADQIVAIETLKSLEIDCLVQEDKVGLYSSINARSGR